ncbi:MAG: transglutaminase family protein [Propionibacteriaceae bacterium]|nr:transglutaminase family protein [Propionibacteriaceae bacterium]
MRLRLKHVAGFRYSGIVHASYNEARLLPSDLEGQLVLTSRLSIKPRAAQYPYTDYFGTNVVAFEVLTPHQELTVESACHVETSRERPGEEPAASSATWEDLSSDRCREVRLIEYSRQSRRTQPVDEVVALAQQAAADAETPAQAAEAICRLVGMRMEYMPGVTGVNSTAAEAWEKGRGVCQDITHIALGALRCAGIPARYVSGYLHPRRDPKVGETVEGESHAWVEYYCGDWIGFDPTNLITIGDRHILVARGRDYDDIAPIRGVYNGDGTSEMFVKVEITRVA